MIDPTLLHLRHLETNPQGTRRLGGADGRHEMSKRERERPCPAHACPRLHRCNNPHMESILTLASFLSPLGFCSPPVGSKRKGRVASTSAQLTHRAPPGRYPHGSAYETQDPPSVLRPHEEKLALGREYCGASISSVRSREDGARRLGARDWSGRMRTGRRHRVRVRKGEFLPATPLEPDGRTYGRDRRVEINRRARLPSPCLPPSSGTFLVIACIR
ncbi:hypothetical protein GW17_00018759 [Ensete ventricosum]|uniref:Uncharacterized protein n=1 Tax=Ensete ventricosum TaxID=4639 RepID=A0A444F3W4_ENSVE|nr:hypothetical protein GW17_00018759 [Ensete ventricosum]RZR74523.1 hypothetical protein BHM03_00037895 [Ensete ventricosum]